MSRSDGVCFFQSEGHAVSVRLVAHESSIIGHPVGRPRWIPWLAFTPVMVGILTAILFEWDGGTRPRINFFVAVVGFVAAVIIMAVFASFLNAMDESMLARGAFFQADAQAQWLDLPRDRICVERDSLIAFHYRKGWHTTCDADGSSSARFHELSIEVDIAGVVARYAVVTAMRGDVVRAIAMKLAELYRVECRGL